MIIFNIDNWKILILTLHHLIILPINEIYFDKSPVLIMVMTTLIAQITGQHPALFLSFLNYERRNLILHMYIKKE